MEINEAIFSRRSIREFTSQEVDEATIGRLIEAAVYAPNAVNQQPWTFTVVRDQDVLDRVSRAAKTHMLATMPSGDHSEHFQSLLTDLTVSMSDFRKNPAKVLRDAKTQPVAVLSHNKAAFYMVDPVLFEALIDEVEDAQLLPMLRARIASAAKGRYIEVDIDSV